MEIMIVEAIINDNDSTIACDFNIITSITVIFTITVNIISFMILALISREL